MSIPPEVLAKILDGPAQKSPDGVYQFDDPPNHNATGLIAVGFFVAIATTVVLLRAYSRLFCSRKVWGFLHTYGCPDTTPGHHYGERLELRSPQVNFLGAFICLVLLAESPGLWVHLWDMRVRDVEPYIKKTFAFVTFYGLTMIFGKAAVLVEWVHIFVPSGRNLFFWISYAVICMNGMLYVAAIIATWFTCIPQSKAWRDWEPGHCFERKKMDETVIVFNLCFDLTILLLPQRVIWKLNTTQRHKLGVALVFSVGLLACVCAAGRVHATFNQNYDDDATYHSVVVEIWSLAEGTCVLMIFCLTAVPKIFRGENHLITKIAHSVRSWTRMPWGSREGSRHSSPQESQKSGEAVYRRMKDIPLADLEAAKSKPNPNEDPKGIIKTNEFSTQEAHNTDSSALFQDQHPWINTTQSQ
ncbi:hypothetical protein PG993_010115 [Apiospora rasikravindrae]|uniref:Rhodopsin domain-containing protein n=1 Tax=Apiospora rasikravindrae TaxID=990691 RepID=A0ABR1SN37_9PEZI